MNLTTAKVFAAHLRKNKVLGWSAALHLIICQIII